MGSREPKIGQTLNSEEALRCLLAASRPGAAVLRPYKGRECSRTIAGVEVVCDNRVDLGAA
jgi:hypothetical protein